MTPVIDVQAFWNQLSDTLDLQGEVRPQDDEWQGVFSVDVRVTRRSSGFNVQGTVAGRLFLCCEKCFEPFERQLELSLNETFVLEHFTDPVNRGKEVELLDDDFYEAVPLKSTVELTDLVRQQLLLEVIPPYLCRPGECVKTD